MIESRGGPHASISETRDLILRTQLSENDPWKRVYAVLLRPENTVEQPDTTRKPRMIGVLGTPRDSEIAYKFHPDFWGRGFAFEALQLFIPLHFSGIYRIFIVHHATFRAYAMQNIQMTTS